MANNKKSTPRYDLKAQDRKRNLAIQLGLTAVVVIFAVAQSTELRQQRRTAQQPGEGIAKTARRPAGGQIDYTAGQAQRCIAQPCDQTFGQAFGKIRACGDGEEIGAAHAGISRARYASASSWASGVPT